jgi:hypothetical protein
MNAQKRALDCFWRPAEETRLSCDEKNGVMKNGCHAAPSSIQNFRPLSKY